MTRGVIAGVVLGAWLGCITAAAQLPPEIQMDRHLVRAKRLLSEDRPWAALAEMDKIVSLQKEHGLTLPEDFHFKHAQVAFAAGRTESAIDSLNKYLVGAGRDSKFYQEALELLDSAEEKFRRDEVQRKRIEAEQRRVDAIQRGHEELARRQIEAAARPLPRDKLVSGGLGPEMVRIAGGRFQYYPSYGKGLPWVEFDQPFAISKYEVTRGQFEQFVKSTRYRTEARRDPKHGCGGDDFSRNSLRWNRPGFDQADTHPVVCVSIHDAMAYAEWLSRETGHNYRLPSGAEWQYAARAGSSTAMLFVEPDDDRHEDPDACRRGNVLDSSTGKKEYAFKCSDGVRRTASVGQFPPNTVGLYDMVGNVEELVLTCASSSGENFVDFSSNPLPEHPDRCNEYVVTRGSSWNSGRFESLDYRAVGALPVKPDRGTRYGVKTYSKNSRGWVGFRVVRDLRNDDSAAK